MRKKPNWNSKESALNEDMFTGRMRPVGVIGNVPPSWPFMVRVAAILLFVVLLVAVVI